MQRPIIQLHQTVQDVLNDWPEARKAFRALKTQCIGCYLARFCTLQDVANTYEIPVETLVAEIEKAVLVSQTVKQTLKRSES
jgi:hypothetical protein